MNSANLNQSTSTSGNNFSDLNDSDYNSDVPGNSANIINKLGIECSSDAEDILRNGILVETEKGLVCMSLNDALSSNPYLSVDDLKKVATQLLTQNTIESPSIHKINPTFNIGESVLNNNFQNNEILLNSYQFSNTFNDNLQSTSTATSEAVDTSEETDKEKNNEPIIQKRKGGWPKGRKRKPELLHVPPKAPKTSYNIFLNERRKLYKDKFAFHEITRVVGNLWSNLTAEEKRPYVERAEEDKKRYREELRVYRQSDAYRLYMLRKRKKRIMDNLMSESDMDGTDDIDDEDDDVLYCESCDQWFYNLHNKREHLLSKHHKLTVAGDLNKKLASKNLDNKNRINSFTQFCTSLDESSLDATSIEAGSSQDNSKINSKKTDDISEYMSNLVEAVQHRENEINLLKTKLQDLKRKQNCLVSELNILKHKSNKMACNLSEMKKEEFTLEQELVGLWNVPSLFVFNNIQFPNE